MVVEGRDCLLKRLMGALPDLSQDPRPVSSTFLLSSRQTIKQYSKMGIKEDKDVEPHVSGQANSPLSRPPHALTTQATAEEIGANTQDGLSVTEASSRLSQYGRNELDDGPGVQPVKILIRQVANAMMLVKQPTFPQMQCRCSDVLAGVDHGHGCQFWNSVVD